MDEAAGYVDFRQSLTHWLTLDAGLRLDHHSHAGTEWVPQGGLSFLLPHNAQIKAMVSKGFRFPTIREMYMFPPQNPDLKPEKLMNYELSFTQRVSDGALSYGVSVYYIDGDNMIQTVPVDGRPKNINTGRIENWGVEGDAACRINPVWAVSANYSYLHMAYPVGCGSRTQALRRGRFFAQTLEGIDGRAVCSRTLHFGQTRSER